ncbi:dTDP-4-dehydrorhamnose reductase [Flavihumibacter petaseus]|uniref:dTDP-4-dehydrorhamnose reductase n=1 Tax=Flavihumibacter petaseus NBRC 106054 TaxID=1220578 RepID=A0A0E9MUF6_9BACT|nr:dTDP-4-dehydrorhamnose reductase [Flavihumibacter petaseus]GAO41209.1 dTDP-4-dehydrorhamnose reductase [Flavihumibacter petaseus NBRC 106054]
MHTILVTGADGQLGSELQVIASLYPEYRFLFTGSSQLDITDEAAVRNIFMQESPAFCINCAAYTAVDKAESEPDKADAVNAAAAGNLAKAADVTGCRLIHISTDYVFDGTATVPLAETAVTNPLGVYGVSKWKGEQLVLSIAPDSIVIRTSWVYSSFGKNFVKTMLRLMAERETINVVNDQQGSPTYAADLARAIMQIVQKLPDTENAGGIYHYANAGAITWFEFAQAIAGMTGSRCRVNPITTAEYPTPAKRPAYSVFDTNRIRQVFDVPVYPWQESLQACLLQLQGYLAGQ